MNKFLFHISTLAIAVLFVSISASAQETYSLSGVVRLEDGESLPGATILIREIEKGQSTDIDGKFEFNLPAGSYTLEITFVGYKKDIRKVNLNKNQKIKCLVLGGAGAGKHLPIPSPAPVTAMI